MGRTRRADRLLTTRDAYPPKVLPDHLVVIGSGVTGVEFVHMFSSLGCEVTLIVSRQQVLPQKDPEVAAVLEADFSRRGVHLLKGARAVGVDRHEDGVIVRCDDGRTVHGIPRPAGHRVGAQLGGAGSGDRRGGGGRGRPRAHQPSLPDERAPHLRRRRPVGEAAAVFGGCHAGPEGGRVRGRRSHGGPPAPQLRAAPPSAIFTEPEIADVGLAEADAFAEGRKIRVTKVPFAASARALIDNDSRGFVKIITDPATGIVLGGSIVGQQRLGAHLGAGGGGHRRPGVNDIVESMLVHPTLAEALAEAAE